MSNIDKIVNFFKACPGYKLKKIKRGLAIAHRKGMFSTEEFVVCRIKFAGSGVRVDVLSAKKTLEEAEVFARREHIII